MSYTWHTPIKFVVYIFTEFKLKISTPLIWGKMSGDRVGGRLQLFLS